MKKLELQFLQADLNRVSEWVRFADQKSAFLSAYYSAILFFLISQKEKIGNTIISFEGCKLYIFTTLLFVVVITLLFGIFFLIKSIFPRLKNHFTDTSLFYFGSIASTKFLDYSKQMEKLTEEESKKQIIEQIYTNSVIADQKMNNIKSATKALFILIILVVVLSLFT